MIEENIAVDTGEKEERINAIYDNFLTVTFSKEVKLFYIDFSIE